MYEICPLLFQKGQIVPFKHCKGMYVKRTFKMYCLMKGA